jgi:hypothetical protein
MAAVWCGLRQRLTCVDVRSVRNSLQLKRFYGLVNRKWGSLYGVRLDHRDLKTPLKNLFLVPSEKLAIAVAQEWEDQEEYIETHYMHLVCVCVCVCVTDTRANVLSVCLMCVCTHYIWSQVCQSGLRRPGPSTATGMGASNHMVQQQVWYDSEYISRFTASANFRSRLLQSNCLLGAIE